MNEPDVIEDEEAADRVGESVRHALQIVGPAEGGAEHVWLEEPTDRQGVARNGGATMPRGRQR